MRGRRLGLALVALLATCAGPCAAPSSSPSPAPASSVWFVEVEGEGGYWLAPETLRTAGLDPAEEAPPGLRLSWAGQMLPVLPLRVPEGWGVLVFAPDRSTRYTRRTALRLEVGVAGEAMVRSDGFSHPGTPQVVTTSVRGDGFSRPGMPQVVTTSEGGLVSIRLEEDNRYLPQADAEVPWFWEALYAPGAVTHTLALDGARAGPVTATLHLWSSTASPADPDHLLRLVWDGRTGGEWRWDGQGMQRLTASWEEGHPEGEHTLVIETPALPGVDVAAVWLDGWDMTYRRRVEASGAIWQAEGAALRVEGARPEARALDVTDPLAPRDLGPLPADGVIETVPGHRYWVGVPAGAPAPLAVRPARQAGQIGAPSYLVVAPFRFHAALQPLLEHRRAEGLEAAVVEPQAVYDTFGNGQPDPQAVRALVQSLPSLRYLLIVGDGSAEPWGYDGEAGALRVVVPLTRTAMLGETPADGLLGTDREGQPSVAVGRFPATSPAEVAAMVQKTLRWESREGPPAILLLNDDGAEFVEMADAIAALLPARMPARRLDTGEGAESRTAVLEALDREATWLNYTGHGGLTLLGDEGVLVVEDGAAWREPALAVTWTCLAAYFIHPAQDSMAETWLRTPRGGAVAFLGPTAETTTEEQAPFARAFYPALVQGARVGDAWLAALQAGDSSDVAWGFVLLGDPALRIRLE